MTAVIGSEPSIVSRISWRKPWEASSRMPLRSTAAIGALLPARPLPDLQARLPHQARRRTVPGRHRARQEPRGLHRPDEDPRHHQRLDGCLGRRPPGPPGHEPHAGNRHNQHPHPSAARTDPDRTVHSPAGAAVGRGNPRLPRGSSHGRQRALRRPATHRRRRTSPRQPCATPHTAEADQDRKALPEPRRGRRARPGGRQAAARARTRLRPAHPADGVLRTPLGRVVGPRHPGSRPPPAPASR